MKKLIGVLAVVILTLAVAAPVAAQHSLVDVTTTPEVSPTPEVTVTPPATEGQDHGQSGDHGNGDELSGDQEQELEDSEVETPEVETPEANSSPDAFELSGTITAIGDGTLTVHIDRGNALVQPFIGTDITLVVNEFPGNILHTEHGSEKLKMDNVVIDMTIQAQGTFTNDVWTAHEVHIGTSQ